MRINADVAPHWFPRFLSHERIFRREPDFPSARNAIQNTLTRASLHERWWVNDPDCLLIRPDSGLSLAEVRSLATAIAMTGGSILLSDDLARVPAERLRIAQQMLPPIGKRPQVHDWFDDPMPSRLRLDLAGPAGEWSLLAMFNWSHRPADFLLNIGDFNLDPSKTYIASEFWRGDLQVIEGSAFSYEKVPAHGCVLAAVRQVSAGPQYIGSDLHVSQGLELDEWDLDARRLNISLKAAGAISGRIFLKLPCKQDSIEFEEIGNNIYAYPVKFFEKMNLEIPISG
jgi:alpha-galactosidase